jgi:hypothetical protein
MRGSLAAMLVATASGASVATVGLGLLFDSLSFVPEVYDLFSILS